MEASEVGGRLVDPLENRPSLFPFSTRLPKGTGAEGGGDSGEVGNTAAASTTSGWAVSTSYNLC